MSNEAALRQIADEYASQHGRPFVVFANRDNSLQVCALDNFTPTPHETTMIYYAAPPRRVVAQKKGGKRRRKQEPQP